MSPFEITLIKDVLVGWVHRWWGRWVVVKLLLVLFNKTTETDGNVMLAGDGVVLDGGDTKEQKIQINYSDYILGIFGPNRKLVFS